MSKKHQILDDIEATLHGIPNTDKVKVAGKTWSIRTIDRDHEKLARKVVDADNPFTAFADSNVPMLAFIVTHINKVPVEELWTPETDDEKAEHARDPALWRARMFADWLGKRDTVVTEKLWLAYLRLKDRYKAALDELEDFSNGTPSGD